MKKFITSISMLSLLMSWSVWATWQLDNTQSTVSFISIKKADVAETHHFTAVKGMIENNGKANVSISLVSAETGIPIRNERMQAMLFATELFPNAVISANVDPKFIETLEQGDSSELMLQGNLELHGIKKSLQLATYVTKLTDNKIMVTSLKPMVINAKDFGLAEGVKKLQQVASLPSISNAVPVSFVLTFTREN